METYNILENNCYNFTQGETNPLRKNNFLNKIIDVLTLNPENSRLDIGGLSFDMDNIIIIGILFFLLTDNSTDILLIICLGLSLLDVDLSSLF